MPPRPLSSIRNMPSLLIAPALAAAMALGLTFAAQAQQAPDLPRIDWVRTPPRERDVITELLASEHWPLRVFALLRLERFTGDDVEAMVRGRLTDNTWQVRCFAIRQAIQMGYHVDPTELPGEAEPHVIRAAVRAGIDLDPEFVAAGTRKLLRIRDVEMLLLGLEIASGTDDEELRAEAQQRFERIVNNMNGLVLARTSRRLARIAGIEPRPQNLDEWRAWYRAHRRDIPLAPPVSETGVKPAPRTEIASMDPETFGRLIAYLNFLKQRDLEVAIAMDFTNSMTPMINQARAGVDSLIVFLNDISRTMALGFVAYRSHETPIQWHDFTRDVESVRNFLFNVQIIGGRDFPENVRRGLAECVELEWSEAAAKQVILVGDAPCFENETYQVMNLIDALRERGIIVHAVHVPVAQGFYTHVTPQWINNFNRDTDRFFEQMAYRGGGRKVILIDAEQLVPSIMHFALEESWWPIFDEFYELYLDACR